MRIKIENLKCPCIIGLYKNERKKKQPLILDIEYEYNPQISLVSENATQIVDYHTLSQMLVAQAQKSSFLLIETLAQALMETIFENQKITYAKVTIKKPRALRPALVSVIHEKTRQD